MSIASSRSPAASSRPAGSWPRRPSTRWWSSSGTTGRARRRTRRSTDRRRARSWWPARGCAPATNTCSPSSSSASASSSSGARWRRRCVPGGRTTWTTSGAACDSGMGPCQGGFCIYRATGILHELDRLDGAEASETLRRFLEERWKGVWPILYGDQLRQARLDDWIFQGILDVEHVPVNVRRDRRRRRDGRPRRRRASRAGRPEGARPRARAPARRISPPSRSTSSATRPGGSSHRSRRCPPSSPSILSTRTQRPAWTRSARRSRGSATRSATRTATSAASSATSCCRARSGRCGRRRSFRRRWRAATCTTTRRSASWGCAR